MDRDETDMRLSRDADDHASLGFHDKSDAMDVDDETEVEEEEEEARLEARREVERRSRLMEIRISDPARQADAIEAVLRMEDDGADTFFDMRGTQNYFLRLARMAVDTNQERDATKLASYFRKIDRYYQGVIGEYYNGIIENPRKKFTRMATQHIQDEAGRRDALSELEVATVESMWVDGPLEGELRERLESMRDETLAIMSQFIAQLERQKRLDWRLRQVQEATATYLEDHPDASAFNPILLKHYAGVDILSADEMRELDRMKNGDMERLWGWEESLKNISMEMFELRFGRQYRDLEEARLRRGIAVDVGSEEAADHFVRLHRQTRRQQDVDARKTQLLEAVNVKQHLYWLPRGVDLEDLSETERFYMEANTMANAMVVRSLTPVGMDLNSNLEHAATRRGAGGDPGRPVTLEERMAYVQRARDGLSEAFTRQRQIMLRIQRRIEADSRVGAPQERSSSGFAVHSGAKRKRKQKRKRRQGGGGDDEDDDERPARQRRVVTENPVEESPATMPVHAREVFSNGDDGASCEPARGFGYSLGFKDGLYAPPRRSGQSSERDGTLRTASTEPGERLHYDPERDEDQEGGAGLPEGDRIAGPRQRLPRADSDEGDMPDADESGMVGLTEEEMDELKQFSETLSGRLATMGSESFMEHTDNLEAWKSLKRIVALRRRVAGTPSSVENTRMLTELLSNDIDLEEYMRYFGFETDGDEPGPPSIGADSMNWRMANVLEALYVRVKEEVMSPAMYGVTHRVRRDEAQTVVESVRQLLGGVIRQHPVEPSDRGSVSARIAYHLAVDAKARIAALVDNVRTYMAPNAIAARRHFNGTLGDVPPQNEQVQSGGWFGLSKEALVRPWYNNPDEIELEENTDRGRFLYPLVVIGLSTGLTYGISYLGKLDKFNLSMNVLGTFHTIYSTAPTDFIKTPQKIGELESTMKDDKSQRVRDLAEKIDKYNKRMRKTSEARNQFMENFGSVVKIADMLRQSSVNQLYRDVMRAVVAGNATEQVNGMIIRDGDTDSGWHIDAEKANDFMTDVSFYPDEILSPLEGHFRESGQTEMANAVRNRDVGGLNENQKVNVIAEYAERLGVHLQQYNGIARIATQVQPSKTTTDLFAFLDAQFVLVHGDSAQIEPPQGNNTFVLEDTNKTLVESVDRLVEMSGDTGLQISRRSSTDDRAIYDLTYKTNNSQTLRGDVSKERMSYTLDFNLLTEWIGENATAALDRVEEIRRGSDENLVQLINDSREAFNEEMRADRDNVLEKVKTLAVNGQIAPDQVRRLEARNLIDAGRRVGSGSDDSRDRVSVVGTMYRASADTPERTEVVGRNDLVEADNNTHAGAQANVDLYDSSARSADEGETTEGPNVGQSVSYQLDLGDSRFEETGDAFFEGADSAYRMYFIANARVVNAMAHAADPQTGRIDRDRYRSNIDYLSNSTAYGDDVNSETSQIGYTLLHQGLPSEVVTPGANLAPLSANVTYNETKEGYDVGFNYYDKHAVVFKFDKEDSGNALAIRAVQDSGPMFLDKENLTDDQLADVRNNIETSRRTNISSAGNARIDMLQTISKFYKHYEGIRHMNTLLSLFAHIPYLKNYVNPIVQEVPGKVPKKKQETARARKRFRDWENMATINDINMFNLNGISTEDDHTYLVRLLEATKAVSREGPIASVFKSLMSVQRRTLSRYLNDATGRFVKDVSDVTLQSATAYAYSYGIATYGETVSNIIQGNPYIVAGMVLLGVGSLVAVGYIGHVVARTNTWAPVKIVGGWVLRVFGWAIIVNVGLYLAAGTPPLANDVAPLYKSAIMGPFKNVLHTFIVRYGTHASVWLESKNKNFTDVHYDARGADVRAQLLDQQFGRAADMLWPTMNNMPVDDITYRYTLTTFTASQSLTLTHTHKIRWVIFLVSLGLLKADEIRNVLNLFDVTALDSIGALHDYAKGLIETHGPSVRFNPQDGINYVQQFVRNATVNFFPRVFADQ